MTMQVKTRVTPFLTYMDQAQQAAEFYTSLLPDSRITRTLHTLDGESVLTVDFELSGMRFVALNAGQDWKFTEAFSLSVGCEDQDEIDRLWSALLVDGGCELACGWLKDKFGMCWQIVPSQLEQWLSANKPDNLQRMFEALWQMKKLDIAQLQKAFNGTD